VKKLVAAGAQIYKYSIWCALDPLHSTGHYDIARQLGLLLLEHSADISITDKEDRTPLPTASGDIENVCMLVKALLVAGANVEPNDGDENTLLHYARKPSIVKTLIEFGADVHRTNKLGHTPLICTTRTNGSYPDIQPENRVEVCRLLISHGANINACGTDGLTALHSAVSCKDAAVAK
jgi:ankyrin repeat protein